MYGIEIGARRYIFAHVCSSVPFDVVSAGEEHNLSPSVVDFKVNTFVDSSWNNYFKEFVVVVAIRAAFA